MMLCDFSNGQPSLDFFDPEILNKLLISNSDLELAYYYSKSKKGLLSLREAYVENISTVNGITYENILITYGVLNGLELIISSHSDLDTCYVIQPTYKEVLKIFNKYGLHVKSLQKEETGVIDTTELCQNLSNGQKVLVYLVPFLNNPDGLSLTLEAKKQLAKLTSNKNCLIIEDIVYRDLYYMEKYSDANNKSILDYVVEGGFFDNKSNIYRLYSLSKTVMPGLRIGFIESSLNNIELLAQNKMDFGTSPVLSILAEKIILDKSLYWKQLQHVNMMLKKKHFIFFENFKSINSVEFLIPKGGYFVWFKLPENVDARFLLSLSERKFGIKYVPGDEFFVDKITNYIRVSIGFEPEEIIKLGANKLRSFFNYILKK